MKETLSTYDIANRLSSNPDNGFSYRGALALAEYLDEVMDEDSEFDAVAIRCDFSEYQSLVAFAEEYFSDYKEELDVEDFEPDSEHDMEVVEDKIRSHIEENGTIIEFDGGVIVSSF